MESAKAAVKDFVKNHGKKDTEVHENVAPAVTHETVKPTQHEEVTTAVDKEVHQDHYHTSVQPIVDRETLPEQHTHKMAGVEHRKFDHGNDSGIQRSVQDEAAKFRDEQVVTGTTKTTGAGAAVGSEHVHHHVHETIQPVVQKETIQPEVVHTTVPVHEVHQNAPQHHSASALPAVSMSEFKAKGGAIGGRGERTDHFEGEPRIASGKGFRDGSYNDTYDSTGRSAGLGSRDEYGSKAGTGLSDDRAGLGSKAGTGLSGGAGSAGVGTATTDSTRKPGLMEKLDPRKDADRDGKKGLMD